MIVVVVVSYSSDTLERAKEIKLTIFNIHWNPVRIIQRFGRIDRIGSSNASIQLVNYWPDISLDEYINLKERVENRMHIVDLTGTGDDNVLSAQANDVSYRKEQLRLLQEEVIELEDLRACSKSFISSIIQDFGIWKEKDTQVILTEKNLNR